MAYMNQEKKKEIAQLLKNIIPLDWKHSLSVRHHSTIVLTIRSAPLDLLTIATEGDECKREYCTLNEYHLNKHFDGELLELFQKILKALNHNNFDKSDIYTDYFHVGHYVDVKIGGWEKPFICTSEPALHTLAEASTMRGINSLDFNN